MQSDWLLGMSRSPLFLLCPLSETQTENFFLVFHLRARRYQLSSMRSFSFTDILHHQSSFFRLILFLLPEREVLPHYNSTSRNSTCACRVCIPQNTFSFRFKLKLCLLFLLLLLLSNSYLTLTHLKTAMHVGSSHTRHENCEETIASLWFISDSACAGVQCFMPNTSTFLFSPNEMLTHTNTFTHTHNTHYTLTHNLTIL